MFSLPFALATEAPSPAASASASASASPAGVSVSVHLCMFGCASFSLFSIFSIGLSSILSCLHYFCDWACILFSRPPTPVLCRRVRWHVFYPLPSGIRCTYPREKFIHQFGTAWVGYQNESKVRNGTAIFARFLAYLWLSMTF